LYNLSSCVLGARSRTDKSHSVWIGSHGLPLPSDRRRAATRRRVCACLGRFGELCRVFFLFSASRPLTTTLCMPPIRESSLRAPLLGGLSVRTSRVSSDARHSAEQRYSAEQHQAIERAAAAATAAQAAAEVAAEAARVAQETLISATEALARDSSSSSDMASLGEPASLEFFSPDPAPRPGADDMELQERRRLRHRCAACDSHTSHLHGTEMGYWRWPPFCSLPCTATFMVRDASGL